METRLSLAEHYEAYSKSVRLKEYADIEDKNVRFSKPSVITGDTYRPDIVSVRDELLVIVDLTTGLRRTFERMDEGKEKSIQT